MEVYDIGAVHMSYTKAESNKTVRDPHRERYGCTNSAKFWLLVLLIALGTKCTDFFYEAVSSCYGRNS